MAVFGISNVEESDDLGSKKQCDSESLRQMLTYLRRTSIRSVIIRVVSSATMLSFESLIPLMWFWLSLLPSRFRFAERVRAALAESEFEGGLRTPLTEAITTLVTARWNCWYLFRGLSRLAIADSSERCVTGEVGKTAIFELHQNNNNKLIPDGKTMSHMRLHKKFEWFRFKVWLM